MKKNSKYIIESETKYVAEKKPNIERIKKSIVFPFNKEIHSLIRFQDMLSFSIVDIYDIKYSGQIGRSVSDILRMESAPNHIIKNIVDVDWDSFDTLIVGHIRDLLAIGNCYEMVQMLFEEAARRKKYIFSFGDVSNYFPIVKANKKNYYVPLLKKENIRMIPDGKLFCTNMPILGIFGTSSKQGKYSLQLALRRKFLSMGYKIGQIGTEASAFLFGMDACFPFGNESTVLFDRFDIISYINYKLFEMSTKRIDLIISGCQAGTITDNESSLFRYTLPQYEFLLALNPDAVILCVNEYNDYYEIERNINFIESSVNCKVIGLVVFPVTLKSENTWYQNRFKTISEKEIEVIKKKLFNQHHRKVYILGNEEDMSTLACSIIHFFSNS